MHFAAAHSRGVRHNIEHKLFRIETLNFAEEKIALHTWKKISYHSFAMRIREHLLKDMPAHGGRMENDPKVPFVSACGRLKCPCEIFLAQLGNAHGQKISYHPLPCR